MTAIWRRGDEDESREKLAQALRGSLSMALPLAALVVLAVSTGFMIYPAGLSAVGEGIGGAVRAVIQPTGINGFASLIALFYEPVLWVLAVVSLILRRDRLTSTDIFLTVWVLAGVIVSLFFADGVPDHALWLTVPLAALAANTLIAALMPEPDGVIAEVAPPRFARWLIAAALIGVLAVFTIAFQSIARALLQTPQSNFALVSPPPDSVILLLVSTAFLVIGYFLFASLWGSRVSWQGVGLGLAIFGALTSLGSGWGAAVPNAANAVEFWHNHATNPDTILLRETLFDVARRQSGGFPSMPLVVIAPDDGEVAWLLRDFDHAQFITDLQDAQNAPVALLPDYGDPPQLGGAYVGQDFTITRWWEPSQIDLVDFPAWWTQTQGRLAWSGEDTVVLWLRTDVYDGLDPNGNPAG